MRFPEGVELLEAPTVVRMGSATAGVSLVEEEPEALDRSASTDETSKETVI